MWFCLAAFFSSGTRCVLAVLVLNACSLCRSQPARAHEKNSAMIARAVSIAGLKLCLCWVLATSLVSLQTAHAQEYVTWWPPGYFTYNGATYDCPPGSVSLVFLLSFFGLCLIACCFVVIHWCSLFFFFRSTYNELYNQTSPSACLPCPAGRSSNQASTNKTIDCFLCSPAFYCEPLNICPNGFLCGGNTTQQLTCPQGRYGAGVSTSAACSGPCQAGTVFLVVFCLRLLGMVCIRPLGLCLSHVHVCCQVISTSQAHSRRQLALDLAQLVTGTFYCVFVVFFSVVC